MAPGVRNRATALRAVMRTDERVSHSGWKFGILSFEKVMGASRSRMAISRWDKYLLKNSLCNKSLRADSWGRALESVLYVNKDCPGYIESPFVKQHLLREM